MSGFAPRTYWVDDPIENFRLRVTLFHDGPPRADPAAPARPPSASGGETEALLPAGRRGRRAQRHRGAGGGSDAEEGAADGDAPEPGAPAEPGSRANPFVAEFGWQQKVLGPAEVRRHRRQLHARPPGAGAGSAPAQSSGRADAESGFRDRSYAEQVAALDRQAAEAGLPPYGGQPLHSKVHSDRFVDTRELHARVTTSALEEPSALARHVLSGRAFDGAQADGGADGGVGGGGGLLVRPPPSQVMHIVAQLDETPGAADGADADSSDDDGIARLRGVRLGGTGGERCSGGVRVLCSLRAYANGRLDMTPGFSPEAPDEQLAGGGPLPVVEALGGAAADGAWYRLSAGGGRVWRFRLENLAHAPEAEAERRAERAARMQLLRARKHLGGVDFAPPPPRGGLVAHLLGEVVGAYGFGGGGSLLVQWVLHVGHGWAAGEEAQLGGTTHACAPKWVEGEHGGEHAAHFGHPFELSLARHAQGGGREQGQPGVGAGISASGAGSSSMGALYVQVVRRTRFGKFLVEGYGYAQLLPQPGMRSLRLATWVPACRTPRQASARFFAAEVTPQPRRSARTRALYPPSALPPQLRSAPSSDPPFRVGCARGLSSPTCAT